MVTTAIVHFYQGDDVLRVCEFQDGAPLPRVGEKVQADPGGQLEVVDVIHDYPASDGDTVDADQIVAPEVLIEVERA